MILLPKLFRRRIERDPLRFPIFAPILEELALAYKRMDIEDIGRAERTFKPREKEEKDLGVVYADDLRKLLALAIAMGYRCAQAQLAARGEAKNDEERQLYREQAQRYDALEDIARYMFWAGARDEIGGRAWTVENIGIRTGWTIIESPSTANPMDIMRGMMRG